MATINATINVNDLDELLEVLNNDSISVDDMTSLPTFGGDEPQDTQGIWSWDETRWIVGASRQYEIEDRTDIENEDAA